jgi:23S rRNA pseudouridine2605 synthase
LTAEQLETSRAERMRQNGHGALTMEDARTWMEETGLCPFAPRRQFSTFTAPSFVEAVAGHHDQAPGPKEVARAEELLVRLELGDVAVRLNLLGQPGEQADYIVASWVLPYVYALRGDRDWRRNPQLTGSRQVSPLAVEAYKLLEAGDQTIPQLKHALGREVSEPAVLRAITELWQQLRIIPVISAPGETPRWQLLRTRFQKAIAEGASTSQVTAISVLASIYLQAVIAASMEEVELFLSPLTARSKVREVLRGLLATRQVHTIQLGHAPHFYVAGTLPEFAPQTTSYASAAMASASSYFNNRYENDHHNDHHDVPETKPEPVASASQGVDEPLEHHAPAARKTVTSGKPAAARHFARPGAHVRDRKPAAGSSSSRSARRPVSETRKPGARVSSSSAARWTAGAAKGEHGNRNGNHNGSGTTSRHHASGNGNGAHASRPAAAGSRERNGSHATWAKHNGHSGKAGNGTSATSRNGNSLRKNGKNDSRSRKPVLTAGAKAGNSRRYGFRAPAKQGTKKRG